jgi:hypothetical protein
MYFGSKAAGESACAEWYDCQAACGIACAEAGIATLQRQ